MKLLLDLGNSRLKWCWHDAAGIHAVEALPWAGRSPAELVAALGSASSAPDEIRLASVAGPAVTAGLAKALAQRYGQEPRLARPAATAPGLQNGYLDPGQLGSDRWLALRAATTAAPGAACVVGVGTACTIDLVAPGGQHLGGVIVPGLALMDAALRDGTGDLARRAAADPPGARPTAGEPLPLVARATGAAIATGVRWALAALVTHHAQSLRGDFPGARLIVTGGDAGQLLPMLPAGTSHRPDLVIEGLACEPFECGPLPVQP